MAFFTFDQNNSGGRFVHDPEAGIGYRVIVEAPNATRANAIAESIGLYWDGCADGRDCPCCGDRWHSVWSDDKGEAEPMYCGVPIAKAAKGEGIEGWLQGWWRLPIYVHYADGRVEAYRSAKDEAGSEA